MSRPRSHRTTFDAAWGWVVHEEGDPDAIVFGRPAQGQPRSYSDCKFEQARREGFPETMTIGDGPILARAEYLRAAFDGVPEPGTDIYVGSSMFLSHGHDDFHGGLVRVVAVLPGISAGKIVPFIEIDERPGTRYNWHSLRDEQEALEARYGEERGHADPDDRLASNEEWKAI